MAFFKIGERQKRPGVHIRIVNRGADAVPKTRDAPVQPTPGITVDYENNIVTLSIPGCTVTRGENGTVTLSGITAPVTFDADGNVTIGG